MRRERGEDDPTDGGEEDDEDGGGDEASERLPVGEGAAEGGERGGVGGAEQVEEAPGGEEREEGGEGEGVGEERDGEGERDEGGVVDAEVGEVLAEAGGGVGEGVRAGERGADMMSMLLDARDEEGGHMTDDELIGHAGVIFAAGYETSSNALSWTLFLLSQHPRVADTRDRAHSSA
jgi:hypothetical protein